jgi:hypothetical protein
MLPSLRHFFRFIDLDETFVAHGFYKKVRHKGPGQTCWAKLTIVLAQIGAAFVLNNKEPACESTSVLDEPASDL